MTVFWPIDVGHSGFCYGWQGPVICIAGVLKTDSESQAEALLRRANDSKQWLPYKNSCGGRDVVLMGKDRPGMDDAVIQNARHSGLDANVINQFNSAKMLEYIIDHPSELHPSPSPSPSPYFVNFLAYTTRWVSTARIKNISATAQQIHVRVQHVDFLVRQFHSLRGRPPVPIAEYSAQYVNSYNSLWLILNDIILGTAFGSFLLENHVVLSTMLHLTVKSVLIDHVQWALHWLNNWPAGLKLNTELSRFYSHTFIYLLVAWGNVLRKGVPYLPSFIYFMGIISSCGITMTISILSDLLAFLTVHIYLCYQISRVVYYQQFNMARSLWNLFRGKRYNVLRNRIDPWDYDMDQLLFGTMLFTLLAFLFPTVLAYYSLFAILRFIMILLHACMETLLAFMNHFPLFALTLRVKDPWRLPGGVYFVASRLSSPALTIKSKPIPLSLIFSQYIGLWSRLSSHYNPLRLLRCLFYGEPLTAVSNYSSIRHH